MAEKLEESYFLHNPRNHRYAKWKIFNIEYRMIRDLEICSGSHN